MAVFQHPQPALVFIVPCLTLSLLGNQWLERRLPMGSYSTAVMTKVGNSQVIWIDALISQIQLIFHLPSHFLLLFAVWDLLEFGSTCSGMGGRTCLSVLAVFNWAWLFAARLQNLWRWIRSPNNNGVAELLDLGVDHAIDAINPHQRRIMSGLSQAEPLVQAMRQLPHLLGVALKALQKQLALSRSQILQQAMRLLLKLLDIPLRKKVVWLLYYFGLPLLI